MKNEYGVFVYNENSDTLFASDFFTNKQDAIKEARRLKKEFKNKYKYIEVWKRDDEGLYGNFGVPIYKSDN